MPNISTVEKVANPGIQMKFPWCFPVVEQTSRIVKVLVRSIQCPEVSKTGDSVRHPSAGS